MDFHTLSLTLPVCCESAFPSKEVSSVVTLTGLSAGGRMEGDWKAGSLRDRVAAPS